jgi:hypothetical protein
MQIVGEDSHAIAGSKDAVLLTMTVGCVKAVFCTGSAAPSRATEVHK